MAKSKERKLSGSGGRTGTGGFPHFGTPYQRSEGLSNGSSSFQVDDFVVT
jgi:hypothetical protein